MTTIRQVDQPFAMPNARQLVSLRSQVLSLAPALAPKSERERQTDLDNFGFALAYIGSALTRTANNEPDQGKSMSWWSDGANLWHSQRQRSSDVHPSHIMAAALALNISHTFDPARWPYDAGIGVNVGGGKPITADDWMHFLETRTLRAPSPLPPQYGKHEVLRPNRGMR